MTNSIMTGPINLNDAGLTESPSNSRERFFSVREQGEHSSASSGRQVTITAETPEA